MYLTGGYWGLSAMEVMGSTKEMNRDEMIQFVLNCRHSSGGFGGNVSHDPHLLYTLSAIQVPCSLSSPLCLTIPVPHFMRNARDMSLVTRRPLTPRLLQILVILDALDAIDKEATVSFIASLQQPDGSVAGDEWGEIDTRFTYCALNCLALLDRCVPPLSQHRAHECLSASSAAVCIE